MTTRREFSLRGCAQLLLVGAVMYLLFGVLSPRFVASFPPLAHYGEVQSFYGVHSGSMYYTDLATSQLTQMHVSNALRFSDGQRNVALP